MTATNRTTADHPMTVAGSEQTASRIERMRVETLLRNHKIDPQQPQLEFWPDDVRALPNDLARSAIFKVRNKREAREALQDVVIFHHDRNVTVTFSGVELRVVDDELVWLQILHYAKIVPLGMPVTFNLHQLVQDVGWTVNGRNYDRARQCLTRLKANSVRIDNERTGRGVAISLIERFAYEDKNYTVWIDRNLVLMFLGSSFGLIDWAPYRGLTPAARKLAEYMVSHRAPYPMTLAKFHMQTGSLGRLDTSFRRDTRKACAELQSSGMVKRCWLHDDDRIYFER